ncbi:hypothetical protein SAMN04515671_3905 [Nakamurella panacisegetis]|uniref:Fibronectin type-III domain-containing protein n=1 Tax=Nakamurella panacisegetis TaxID=1090615 RepID=A0A1H0S4Q7_9ACTN|nr:hypothetical protein [Nakamurella panacisegetis]SDP36732.1 hypothetical protein SAMN04515671_3905 [Nakamurella panacisegetis]
MRFHRRRIAIAGAGLTLLLTSLPSATSATSASWNDNEFGAGAFSAKTIPPPTISACVLQSGLLGANPVVTITWQLPIGAGYSLTNIHYYTNGGSGLTEILAGNPGLTTTGPSGGNYTTAFSSGLLSGLLGSSYIIGLRSAENGWSSTLSSWTAAMGLLGANPTCTANPQTP